MQLGTHKDGGPNQVGTWNATPGVSFEEFRSDIGNLYAVKDFADASGRRIMWGWVTASPACISLPREITYHPRLKQLVFSPVCTLTQTSLLRLRSDLSRLAVGGRYPSCPSCGRPRRWRNLRLSSSRGTPLTTSAPAGPQGRATLARLSCPSECPPSRHAAAYESWETGREMLARWMCGWSSSRRATAAKPAGPSASGVSDPPAFASEFLPRLADRPFFFRAVDYLPKANSPKGAMHNQLQLLPTDDALTMQVFTDRTHIEAFFVRSPPSPHILLH